MSVTDFNKNIRVSRTCNVEFSTAGDGTSADIILPGFSYNDFNHSGYLNASSLSRLIEVNRAFAVLFPRSSFSDRLPKDNVIFVLAATTIKLSPEFAKHTLLHGPKRFRFRPGPVGKTSFSIMAEIQDLVTKKVLVNSQRLIVSIDDTTRKSVPLPGGISRAYSRHQSSTQPMKLVRVPSRPVDYYAHQIKVAPSDEDNFQHTNASNYFRFCLEAASRAAVTTQFRQFPNDIYRLPIKQIDALYKGQTVAGDKLVVSVWEDPEQILTLHFQIDKEHPIMVCNIEFFPLTNSKM